MRKFLILLSAGMVAVAVSSALAVTEQATGSARLRQINQSGVQGRIIFLDTGTPLNRLVVSGKATGLDPTKTYVSLVYDVGSVPGPEACEPSATPSPLIGLRMFVGTWQVAPNGTGTLFATKNGPAYVPMTDFDTISIGVRLQPPPALAVLQACGEVHRNPF